MDWPYIFVKPDPSRLDDPNNARYIRSFLRGPLDPRTKKLLAGTLAFFSGISTPTDLAPFIVANKPVGVSVAWLSAELQWKVILYARWAGRVFIDNGAVAALNKGRTIDPDDVMVKFRHLCDMLHNRGLRESSHSNVSMVMMDAIGDQRASLAMQKRYKSDIRELITQGIDVLIPVQRGRLSPGQVLGEIRHMLGTDKFRIAVPSNRSALDLTALGDLLSDSKGVRGVHLLGLAWRLEKLIPRLHLIKQLLPRAVVSTDAAWTREYFGVGKPITDWSHTIAGEMDDAAQQGKGPFAECDEIGISRSPAEIFYDGGLTREELRRLIRVMRLDPDDPATWKKFEQANRAGYAQGGLFDLCLEYDPLQYFSLDVARALFFPDAHREINAYARQQSIALGLHVQDNQKDFAEGGQARKKHRGAAKLGAEIVGRKARQQHGAKYTHKKRSGRTENACIKAINDLKKKGVKRSWPALGAMVGKSPSHLCRNYKRLQELFG